MESEEYCHKIRKSRWGVMGENIEANRLHRLIQIGIALSAERDINRLMEMILLEAKGLSNADGGTLYIRSDDDSLKFEIIRTDSLNIAMGGTTGKRINFPPVNMYDPETSKPNLKQVASAAALTSKSINIADAYDDQDYDFSGTKKFDSQTGYRSKSFLTVPLKNSQNQIIGVLQLLNAIDPNTNDVIAFNASIQPLIEALASQAAIALDNQQLLEGQKRLLDSFIELIASAIDAKSPYTGGHCQRVPELTKMMAQAACESNEKTFKSFNLNEEQWYELHVGAWLHDCGKVTTPEYVVDKATKLETIYDRIHEVRTRFEVVKRDAEIYYLKALIANEGSAEDLGVALKNQLAKLDDDFAFIAESNLGGEFMAPERVDRLKKIGAVEWTRTLDDRIGISFEEQNRKNLSPTTSLPVVEKLLDDRADHIIKHERTSQAFTDGNPFGFKMEIPEYKFNLGEVYNLSVGRGTLTEEERYKINDHIVQTIVMLEQLPFPKHLARVPEYAGGHHEKMDGTGYPRKLIKNEMSLPARIMAIADIFEALTASDRPYKPPKKLSDAIEIMSFMKKDAHIDGDLFELFLTSGVYKKYAERFLDQGQMDEVDISQYLSQKKEN
jgi:HD-GYP domain-containing protein (c-di-GMP phosphodiesterase class II)